MRAAIVVAIACAFACKKEPPATGGSIASGGSSAKPGSNAGSAAVAPPPTGGASFQAAYGTCGAALGTRPLDVGAAFVACADLVGTGACSDAWRAAPSRKEFLGVMLTILDACTQQYCPSLSAPKPAACTTPKASWTGSEVDVWVELHAAIMGAVFADEHKLPPGIIAKYRALPKHPTPEQFGAFVAEFQAIDPATATEDGRAVVYGMAAQLLASAFFRPIETIVRQQPIP